MSAGAEWPVIEKGVLLERLAQGGPAAPTVVTPNKRLSQALMLEFDAFQVAKALSVWEAPDILPFGAFVQRLYEDGLYADLPAELPMLLTPAQEEEVWKQVVGGSGLLAVEGAAAKCRDAWNLANLWRIRPGAANQDTEAFARWLAQYKRKTENDLDTPQLPDALQRFLPELKRPRLLVAYAFDILPPQTKEFLDALGTEIASCRPNPRSATVSRAAFDSAKHEIEAAARWARARLEAGGKRIGVVVPSLQEKRKEVVRVFSRIMRPGGEKTAMPFDVSLGAPLQEFPIVNAALTVLHFSQEEIPFEEASRIVRSPFIAAAESELGARMKLETRLRDKLGATVALPKLIAFLEKKTVLRERLERVFGMREDGLFSQKTPAEWARHFSSVLDAAGFPGERALDSDEFQALAKWHEALGELSRLDRISKEMSFSQAFQTLRKICADTLFQPETPDTPIQVLGLLESAGVEFDHLWVTGLTDDAWPLKSSPNPFLPLAQQRKAGIPEASAETSLALDRRITDGWKQAAGEVVFSHFTKEEDRDVLPSPLIADLPEKAVELPAFPRLRDVIFASRKTETLQDRVAPAVREKQVRGGTRVLSDQAACPFRAFARHRLHAGDLEEPAEGLDASKRGKLVHLLMQNVWDELKDSTALQGDLSPAIERAAAAAVKEMAVEGRFAELERERLARLGHEWFEKVEQQRPPFSVVSTEEKRPIVFGGVTFDARIDRMDRLESGGHAIVDYKTGGGNLTAKRWQGERPDEPQLPLYAVSAKEEITAVVFAKFRPGDMRFVGLSRDDKALPKVPKAKDGWQPLLRDWKKEAERLGQSFASGEAGVDPKKELITCRYCGLETLCRVYEKINVLAEEEPEEWQT
jgi:ATP-dependent helicase/nuclease subunit B